MRDSFRQELTDATGPDFRRSLSNRTLRRLSSSELRMAPFGNWNVTFELLAAVLEGIAYSVLDVIASPLYFDLTGKYFYVGLADGLPSCFQLISAIPGALWADKKRTETPKNLGLLLAVLGTVVAVLSFASFEYFQFFASLFTLYWIIIAGLSMMQFGQGLAQGSIGSIFQNSIESGEARTRFNMYRGVAYGVGGLTGPLISIVVLFVSSTTKGWGIPSLVFPLAIVGVGFVSAQGLRLQLSLKRELGVESDDVIETNKLLDAKANISRKVCGLGYTAIPFLMAGADLCIMLAAGLSVRFFSLWLLELGLSQVELNIVYAASAASLIVTSVIAERISRSFGRIQTDLLGRALGLTAFVAIVVGKSFGWWDMPWLQASLLLLRRCLISSGQSLGAAVVSDFVDKKRRALWNTLESLTLFAWSASALLGGYLLDAFSDPSDPLVGYRNLFAITLTLQGLALIPMVILLFLVPREQTSTVKASRNLDDPNSTSADEDGGDKMRLLNDNLEDECETADVLH